MQNFDLESIGLSNMDSNEMENVNGGYWWAIAAAIADAAIEFYNGFTSPSAQAQIKSVWGK
jgi:lactobin A/cerein 7B family class IIb bacteriocin